MYSTPSYIFSNDARATAFRRAVRSKVAHSQEYAMPGSGASAQEVQREYLRYCAEQDQGQSDGAQQATPPYIPAMNGQAPPPYMSSADAEALPPYPSTPTSDMTPTAQLDFLLYSNTSTPPSSPEYAEAVSTPPPPSYESLVSAHTPTTSNSNNYTHQALSHQNINTLFAKCTTRSPKEQFRNRAIQALELVVLPGNGIEVSPKYSSPKKPGILRRIKDRV